MVEYGYLHGDAAPMQFRSRLSADELRQESRERAEGAARVLDRFRDHERYLKFLEIYSPLSDPFLHEARVHLFRRDVHLERAKSGEQGDSQGRNFAIAYWENRFLSEYFGQTLRASSYQWPAELEAKLGALRPLGGPGGPQRNGTTMFGYAAYMLCLARMLRCRLFGRSLGNLECRDAAPLRAGFGRPFCF